MPRDGKEEDKKWQISVILVGVLPALLFSGNSKNSTAGAFALAVVAGLVLHEIGKQRRVGLFDNPGNNVQNALENVIEGGAAIGDEVEKFFEAPSKK